jgi:hypothetical protein
MVDEESGGGGEGTKTFASELRGTRTKIGAVKAFFVDVQKKWSKAKDHVIGYVHWAPSIGVAVPPHAVCHHTFLGTCLA